MDNAALVVWLLTAGGGLTLATIWLARGGLRQRDEVLESSYVHVADATDVAGLAPPPRQSRLPAWMITTHAALAALGLFLWIYYVGHEGEEGTGIGALPPLVVGLLLMVAAIGATMVRRWRAQRTRLDAHEVPKAERPPEQRFPAAVVALHGLLAVATIALVFLTAVGVGD
jgi:manganese efflux pump family protein